MFLSHWHCKNTEIETCPIIEPHHFRPGTMCKASPASCRLCLSPNLSPPYTDLREDPAQAGLICRVLSLQLSLHSLHQPRHVCHECSETIEAFVRLRDLAHKNQQLLSESQNTMVMAVVPVKHSDEEDGMSDSKEDNIGYDDDFVASENMIEVKSEQKTEKEDENHLVKISFLKTEKEKKNCKDKIRDKSGKSHVYKPRGSKPKGPRDGDMRGRKIVEALIKELKAEDDPDIKLTCPICRKVQMKRYELASHIKWRHREPDIPCTYEGCKALFKTKADLKGHVLKCHETVKQLCNICGDYFKNLDNHVRMIHLGEEIRCEFCNKSYKSKFGLKHHIKYEHEGKKKKEVCYICAKEVQDVKNHIAYAHQGGNQNKTIPCRAEDCDRMFLAKSLMLKHYNATHMNKREQCPQCNGWFKNVYQHISQIHTNSKRYPCDQVICRN